MDDDKVAKAIAFGVLWFGLAPLVALFGPALMIGTGTMEENWDIYEGTVETYGFWNAFGNVYGAAFAMAGPIILLYVACLAAMGLRFRAPLGGGNAAVAVILIAAATAFIVTGFADVDNGAGAFGAGLFGFFLALPGAIAAAIGLSSWGRRLVATEVHFEAQRAKNEAAENAYMD